MGRYAIVDRAADVVEVFERMEDVWPCLRPGESIVDLGPSGHDYDIVATKEGGVPYGDMIPLHKVDVECLGLLLEYVQEMADPRVPRARFLELMVGLADEWAKHGGDGLTNDVLNALYLFEQAEAREAEEAQRRAQDERDGWDGSHHDRHEEKGEGR